MYLLWRRGTKGPWPAAVVVTRSQPSARGLHGQRLGIARRTESSVPAQGWLQSKRSLLSYQES